MKKLVVLFCSLFAFSIYALPPLHLPERYSEVLDTFIKKHEACSGRFFRYTLKSLLYYRVVDLNLLKYKNCFREEVINKVTERHFSGLYRKDLLQTMPADEKDAVSAYENFIYDFLKELFSGIDMHALDQYDTSSGNIILPSLFSCHFSPANRCPLEDYITIHFKQGTYNELLKFIVGLHISEEIYIHTLMYKKLFDGSIWFAPFKKV